MPFPNLALIKPEQAHTAQAEGAPDDGLNTFALGLDPFMVELDFLRLHVDKITGSVGKVEFVGYDAATGQITLNIPAPTGGTCRITAWMPSPDEQ